MVATAIIYLSACMDRITVADLRKLIDDGQEVVILDVRPKEIRVQEGTIPGAVAAHPADIDPALNTYPRDMEIVAYCARPNEELAATAAKHLMRAGFKKIRPLWAGHIWAELGIPSSAPARKEGEALPSAAAHQVIESEKAPAKLA